MCGIAGGIHHRPTPEERRQVLQRLRHRGPDDSGYYESEDVWMLNTRLAIQDLSWEGHQPMKSSDGRITIVYNGELYNVGPLRAKLEKLGASFRSACDTEVVLAAYVYMGAACLEELEGDFAFAVWDQLSRELFIARDRMGVKPLYIYDDGKQLLFASELKALAGLKGINYALDKNAIFDYLLYLYSPSDATPFRFVRKLMPGHYLRICPDTEEREIRRYYRLPLGKTKIKSVSEWRDTLDQLLQNVVSEQLVADVPVGVMLSGGLDSSLIAAYSRQANKDLPLAAFTVNTNKELAVEGFKDDLQFARIAAAALGCTLTEIPGDVEPNANGLDAFVWNMDEPQADPAGWYTALIASAAQNSGVRVLLSGTGGDDVFSGYRRHLAIPYYGRMKYIPKWLSSVGRSGLQNRPNIRRVTKLLSSSGLPARQAAIHSHFWASPERINKLFAEQPTSGNTYSLFESMLEEAEGNLDQLEEMLLWEQRSFLPHHNLAYMDKMCMAHSVEARVPFADHRIVELAAMMPSSIKLNGNITKHILREVAKGYLPESIIWRKKTGFAAPLRKWIKADMAEMINARLLDKNVDGMGIFSRVQIADLIKHNKEGKTDGAYTLFSLLCLESWIRQFGSSS